MRIRRRPPGQPLAYLLPSDPSAALQPPRDHRERTPPPPGDKQGEGDLHLHPGPTNDSAADLGDARSSSPLIRRPALPPQDGAVERGTGLQGAQQQQLQQGPADGGRSSLENGLHRHVTEPMMIQAAGERLSNNDVGAAVAVAVTATATKGAKATKKQQQETKKDSSGGVKRAPRGPAGVLMEGSRCSRKNGRGWRCSQPTQVGYALCQYHLGKGRVMKSGTAAGGGRGPGQLGRTEHAKKTSAAAAAAPATAAPKADVPPLPSVQQC